MLSNILIIFAYLFTLASLTTLTLCKTTTFAKTFFVYPETIVIYRALRLLVPTTHSAVLRRRRILRDGFRRVEAWDNGWAVMIQTSWYEYTLHHYGDRLAGWRRILQSGPEYFWRIMGVLPQILLTTAYLYLAMDLPLVQAQPEPETTDNSNGPDLLKDPGWIAALLIPAVVVIGFVVAISAWMAWIWYTNRKERLEEEAFQRGQTMRPTNGWCWVYLVSSRALIREELRRKYPSIVTKRVLQEIVRRYRQEIGNRVCFVTNPEDEIQHVVPAFAGSMTAKDAIARLRDEQHIGVTNEEMLAAFTSVVNNINRRLPEGTEEATPQSLLTAL